MDRTCAALLGLAVASASVPVDAGAGTASARLSVRLVVEPPCPGNAPKAVASEEAAHALARQHLGTADLVVEHDVADTGYWLVSSEGDAVLRIAKCTGAVAPAVPPTENARSLAEPGASVVSG